MTGYECYSIYNSLKLHFTSEKYDYFKYLGKSRVSIDTFEKRKDKYFFHKLSRRYNKDELINFLVANFMKNHNVWIGSLLEDSADVLYKEQMGVQQSLGYIFRDECSKTFSMCENPNDILRTDGQYPQLLSNTLQGEIHVETLVILNDLLGFFSMWNQKIQDSIRWPDFRLTCLKYRPFLHYDKDVYKGYLVQILNK